MDWSLVLTASGASAAAGLATGAGALPVFFISDARSDRFEKLFLGFAAGVMVAASFFSLIVPGLAQAEAAGHGPVAAAAIVVGAVLLGALGLQALGRFAPSIGSTLARPDGIGDQQFQRVWLFITAITLHNLPEGMAVGVSFGGGDMANGAATAVGIGLQNAPEGLAVALLAASLGYRRRSAFLLALASGLVEPVTGFLGIMLVSAAEALLPWGLGAAAGAMLYIVAAEIIPESQRQRSEGAAVSFMGGLALMLFLDVTLG